MSFYVCMAAITWSVTHEQHLSKILYIPMTATRIGKSNINYTITSVQLLEVNIKSTPYFQRSSRKTSATSYPILSSQSCKMKCVNTLSACTTATREKCRALFQWKRRTFFVIYEFNVVLQQDVFISSMKWSHVYINVNHVIFQTWKPSLKLGLQMRL